MRRLIKTPSGWRQGDRRKISGWPLIGCLPGGRRQSMTMFPRPLSHFSVLAALALLIPATGGESLAQETSFAGKKLNAIIGATPGGGTDLTTRLVGRFLE